MVDPLQTVLVRRPDAAFGAADPARWHYTARPNLEQAQAEHDAFVTLLREAGVRPIYHDAPLPDHADAIFVHDPVLITRQGAILLKMGKALRRGEEAAIEQTLAALEIPIHYRLQGDAVAEGGDLLWIDNDTLAVGQGFRTNAAALAQLREALPDVEVVPVPLPYFQGPDACLHLMSFISIVDRDLAVVYRPLLPVPFYELLAARGFRFVDVPEAEFATMGPNVLALAPGRCVMLAGNPVTQARLEAAGCEVLTYAGDEISLKAEGGATCLTRPLLRAEIPYPIVNPHLAGDAFLWQGGAVGVLLIHGLTATTAEVRLLAQVLHAAGCTVAGPLLPGHGTRPEHLNQVSWQDWVWEVEQLYQHLATICDRVVVGGESTGAVLALELASRHPEITAVLAYAPAIQLPLPMADVVKLYASAPFMEFVPKAQAGGNPHWQGYPVNPLRGVIELIRLGREVRERLPRVTQPLLIVQGRHDTTIHPDSGDIILEGVASEIKRRYWMKNSAHVVLLEEERERIEALTKAFLAEVL
ncbi:MAG: alpha/beta fold hydrolase [Anaerolineales bacterium]|nr:alpha/beta fold hydrolase [Anaerolineales bacterium]